jgi:ABC-2 type transport system ATP-binding protein
MVTQYAVELEGASKRFGNFEAVHPIDLAIPSGSIYGFIGPNGSGKTTTMRMVLRIYQPDSGIVRVLGNEHGECADDRVGYLPEERGLYRKMTVRRVLRYFARIKGNRHPDEGIDYWMERLGGADWYKKRVDQLSKGMAQKVQFVAAVVANPKLVILDEPFSGLDPVNRDILRDAVLDLRKKGTTVIFSTHDMTMAEQMCDSVCMIFKGHKVLDGTIDGVKSQHGEPRLRVKLAGGQSVPTNLQDVQQTITSGGETDLLLKPGANKRGILAQLIEHGDVEHFEMVRPSLHDIFVQIAKPDATT